MTEQLPPPITRDQLLSGLSGRRVSTVLFAIERRTAHLALEARHAVAPAICEDLAVTRQRAFLSALGSGRTVQMAPTIQQLERFAPVWAHLVPPDAPTRAELARGIGEKYPVRAADVPRLRAALATDDVAVRRAFRAHHGHDLDTVFVHMVPVRERLRWVWSRLAGRLEELPPFWSAYSLTLTQTVGAGVLALPIALAGVGPLPGLVLVAGLGLVNVLTAAAVAESFTRTGTVRWGGAYFGRVVTQYLGTTAGVVLSLMLAALSVVALLAYYVGLSGTLTVATGVPPSLWAGALFAITVGFAWRGRLDATVATALLVGAVNIVIVLVLSLLALQELRLVNLTAAAVPFVGGRGFEPELFELVFGVVLLAFFGHTAVGNGARTVLQRDPSGRSLVRGTAAAMVTALGLYGVWSVAVGGAVSPRRLSTESGTALEPLAEALGPVVVVLGTIFAVLAMGMAAVQFSIGLHFQAAEVLAGRGRLAPLGGFAPLLVVFVVVEWLLLTGRESFTGSLSLVGTLTGPLLAGVFPVLLLAAARRSGDYLPSATAPWMQRPAVRAAVYAVFVGAVVAHGAVIWQHPVARAGAFATAGVVLVLTVRVARAGAFRPRATVEIRRDRELGTHRLRLTANGRRGSAPVRIRHAGGEEHAGLAGAFDVPATAVAVAIDLAPVDADVVTVWAHEIDPSGSSVPLSAAALLREDGRSRRLELVDGRATVPLDAVGGPRPVLEVELSARHGAGGVRRP